MEGNVEIKGSRSKSFVVFVASLLFVAFGVWLAAGSAARGQAYAGGMVAGWLTIAFFGMAAGFAGYKLFDPRPALILTPDRLINRSAAFQIPEVLWSEVSYAEIVPFMNQRMLILHLHEPEAILARQTPAVQRIQSANIPLLGSPVTIAGSMLSIPLDRVLEMINARLREP